MSSRQRWGNFVETTLLNPITSGAASLDTAAGGGTGVGALAAGEFFRIVLEKADFSAREIVKSTSHANNSDTFASLTRGQDGTAATAWAAGDKLRIDILRADLDGMAQLDADETFTGKQRFDLPVELTIQSSNPSAPASAVACAFVKRVGRAALLHMLDSLARDPMIVEPSLVSHNALWTLPAGSALQHFGWDGNSSGAATSSTPATGSLLQETARAILTAATAANAVGSLRNSSQRFFHRGSAASRGGFLQFLRFSLEAGFAAGGRVFIGAWSDNGGASGTNGNPSTNTGHFICIGSDDNEADLNIFTRDNTTFKRTALQTPVSKVNAAGKLFDLVMYCDPNELAIRLLLIRWDTYTPTILNDTDLVAADNIPLNTAFLHPLAAIGAGSTGVAGQAIGIGKLAAFWQ